MNIKIKEATVVLAALAAVNDLGEAVDRIRGLELVVRRVGGLDLGWEWEPSGEQIDELDAIQEECRRLVPQDGPNPRQEKGI